MHTVTRGLKKEMSYSSNIFPFPSPVATYKLFHTVVIVWKRWEHQTAWPASWETYMQVRKQQLELNMEQQTGSK